MINKALRCLIFVSITTNAAVLAIDYFTRNSADSAYSSLANVLTLALILSLTVTVFTIISVLIKARGNFKVIESSTWMLLACWVAILIATLPLEEWITSQSYRRGA
jgi:hypothetical protein